MKTGTSRQVKTAMTSRPYFTSSRNVLLQRKCACGATSESNGECEECRRRKSRCAATLLETNIRGFIETPIGHSFSNVPLHSSEQTAGAVHRNAIQDDVTSEEPLIQEPKQGSPIEQMPTITVGEGAQPLQSGGTTQATCPTKTAVEKTIDMTPEGIKKGYRSGYGACSVMRVEPDSTNWDGTKIVESNKQTKNTCPTEFGISPCSGSDTFTVGLESNSSILGRMPATKNRFYDYHTTRWNKGSLLHDRNPNNMASCEIVCEQNYSCGGNVIGTHTITRAFTKGTSGSRDVTLVAVTKT